MGWRTTIRESVIQALNALRASDRLSRRGLIRVYNSVRRRRGDGRRPRPTAVLQPAAHHAADRVFERLERITETEPTGT